MSLDKKPGARSQKAEALMAKIAARTARIGVVGLGYVGLPLLRAFASQGFPVTGFDIDPTKIAQLKAGQSYIRHLDGAYFKSLVDEGRFLPTTDFSAVRDLDACLICVPTPLNKHREPDLRFVESTGHSLAPYLQPGQLIVLESTTYPGTTRDLLRPILEASGLQTGQDFFLAFSPEREDPGNPQFETSSIPKVVGADDEQSQTVALALYAPIVPQTVPVSSTSAAEAVKLTENIFRSVNIALVNELKMIFGAMDIDVWEVIEAAKTKPFGYMPFYPGPGLGGHCIPIDPFYLAWKARGHDMNARFIELAGEINTAMPHYVLGLLAEALDRRFGRGLNGASILILGVAYKKNVDDMRESPALKLISMLKDRGAQLAFHDPYVPVIPMTREHPEFAGLTSIPLTEEALAKADAVLIVTDHDALDYGFVVRHARLVVDSRNATRAVAARDKIVKA